MSQKYIHQEVQYIEFLTPDIKRIKTFYQTAFGWEFTDYGEQYAAFSGQFVDGGFALGEARAGSVLVILYSNDLLATKSAVETAGGQITKNIFSFPGGQRFQFTDPDGNELAVWSDTGTITT